MSDHVQVVEVQPVPAQNGKGTHGFEPCILNNRCCAGSYLGLCLITADREATRAELGKRRVKVSLPEARLAVREARQRRGELALSEPASA